MVPGILLLLSLVLLVGLAFAITGIVKRNQKIESISSEFSLNKRGVHIFVDASDALARGDLATAVYCAAELNLNYCEDPDHLVYGGHYLVRTLLVAILSKVSLSDENFIEKGKLRELAKQYELTN